MLQLIYVFMLSNAGIESYTTKFKHCFNFKTRIEMNVKEGTTKTKTIMIS